MLPRIKTCGLRLLIINSFLFCRLGWEILLWWEMRHGPWCAKARQRNKWVIYFHLLCSRPFLLCLLTYSSFFFCIEAICCSSLDYSPVDWWWLAEHFIYKGHGTLVFIIFQHVNVKFFAVQTYVPHQAISSKLIIVICSVKLWYPMNLITKIFV